MKKKEIFKKTMATMLSGVCIVSGITMPTETVHAGLGFTCSKPVLLSK